MKLFDFNYFPPFKLGSDDKIKQYHFWPISFGWGCHASDGARLEGTGAHAFICAHGWQTGWLDFGVRKYGFTIHIGMLKIFFGPRAEDIVGGGE